LLVYNGYYLEEGALFLNTALERLSTCGQTVEMKLEPLV
jgi:hypothetical protein